MGIDIDSFQFLVYALKKKKFGRTATMGRQEIRPLRRKDIKRILHLPKEIDYGEWCENLLIDHFHSSKVDSFDYSDYEDCTFTHDMNKPLPSTLTTPNHQYDTILDIGTFEHIYNLPQAFKNISSMCADGGVIIHAVPANNMCGHGFWQFSPELFYSLYSESNGYAETEVFFVNKTNSKYWYKVKIPENGIRRVVQNKDEVYALVRTKKVKTFSHDNVQQSDFVRVWDQKNSNVENRLIKKLENIMKKHESFLPLCNSVYWWLYSIKHPEHLSSRNEHLIKKSATDWINT